MHVLVFPAPLEVAPEALVPTFSKLLGALGRALLMPLLVVALVGCPRHSGPDTTLPPGHHGEPGRGRRGARRA
jgi:hypothetical protein